MMRQRYRRKCCCVRCTLDDSERCFQPGSAFYTYLKKTTIEGVAVPDFRLKLHWGTLSQTTFTGVYFSGYGITANFSFDIATGGDTVLRRPALIGACEAVASMVGPGWVERSTEYEFDGSTEGLPAWLANLTIDAPPSSWSSGGYDYESRNFTVTEEANDGTRAYAEGAASPGGIGVRFGLVSRLTRRVNFEIRERPSGEDWSPWFEVGSFLVEPVLTIVTGGITDPGSDPLDDVGPINLATGAAQTFALTDPVVRVMAFTSDPSGVTWSVTASDATITIEANPDDPQLLDAPRSIEVTYDWGGGPSARVYDRVCFRPSFCSVSVLDRWYLQRGETTPSSPPSVPSVPPSTALYLAGPAMWTFGNQQLYEPIPLNNLGSEGFNFIGWRALPDDPLPTLAVEEVSGTPMTIAVAADPDCADCPGTITAILTGDDAGTYTLAQSGDTCVWSGSGVTVDTIDDGATWRLVSPNGEWRAVRTCRCPVGLTWTAQPGTTGTARTG